MAGECGCAAGWASMHGGALLRKWPPCVVNDRTSIGREEFIPWPCDTFEPALQLFLIIINAV